MGQPGDLLGSRRTAPCWVS